MVLEVLGRDHVRRPVASWDAGMVVGWTRVSILVRPGAPSWLQDGVPGSPNPVPDRQPPVCATFCKVFEGLAESSRRPYGDFTDR